MQDFSAFSFPGFEWQALSQLISVTGDDYDDDNDGDDDDGDDDYDYDDDGLLVPWLRVVSLKSTDISYR